MKLTPAVEVKPCGIKLLALLQRKDGTWYTKEHQWGLVNHHLAEVLNPTLEELADHGAIAIYTMGIRNNRPIRGSSRTSTHSNGLIENGYKHWRTESDGKTTVGALGIDIRKVLFQHGQYKANLTAPVHDFQSSLVVTDPGDLKAMIQWLEARDWQLYHKKLDSVIPYHLHCQPKNLRGVL